MGLTPLRWAGLLAALGFAVLSIRSYRQGKIGNGDLLVRFVVFVLPLVVFSLVSGSAGCVRRAPPRQRRPRIPGATVPRWGFCSPFAFALEGRTERARRDLTRLIEKSGAGQFRQTGHPSSRAASRSSSRLQRGRQHRPRAALAPQRVREGAARPGDRRRFGRQHDRPRPRGGAAVRLAQPRPGRGPRTGYRLALPPGPTWW